MLRILLLLVLVSCKAELTNYNDITTGQGMFRFLLLKSVNEEIFYWLKMRSTYFYGLYFDTHSQVLFMTTHRRRIDKISGTRVTTLAGSDTEGNQDGVGTNARFYRIGSMVIDSQGNLFVSDYSSSSYNYTKIRKITPDGTVSTLQLRFR